MEEINPLQTTFKQRCIVSSRDALLRRSAEIKHFVVQICSKEHLFLSFIPTMLLELRGKYFVQLDLDVASVHGKIDSCMHPNT